MIGQYRLKEIATELGYDPGQFSKIINPLPDKTFSDDAYKRLLQRLQILTENRELRQEVLTLHGKRRQFQASGLLNIGLSILALLLTGLSVYQWDQLREVQRNPGDRIIKDFAAYQALQEEKGLKAADAVARTAYAVVEPYFQQVDRGKALSDAQRVEIITKIQDFVRRGIGQARVEQAKQQQFIYHKRLNMVEVLEHIIPVDRCFECPPAAMLSSTLPDCANIFDAKL